MAKIEITNNIRRLRFDRGEAAAEGSTATAISASVPLAIAEDEQTAGEIAAGWLLAYLTRMGPLYPRMLRDHFGFAREVDALLNANGSGHGCQRMRSAWLERSR